jgi:hypothetical protein
VAKGSENQQLPFPSRYLNDFLEITAADIQKTRKTAMLFTLPAFSGMILMVRDMMTCACPPLADCQGFGVAHYSLTLGRLGSTAPSAFASLRLSDDSYTGFKIIVIDDPPHFCGFYLSSTFAMIIMVLRGHFLVYGSSHHG